MYITNLCPQMCFDTLETTYPSDSREAFLPLSMFPRKYRYVFSYDFDYSTVCFLFPGDVIACQPISLHQREECSSIGLDCYPYDTSSTKYNPIALLFILFYEIIIFDLLMTCQQLF